MAAALSKMKIKACMLINIATGLFGFYILETRHVFSLPDPMNAALLSNATQATLFCQILLPSLVEQLRQDGQLQHSKLNFFVCLTQWQNKW